jgi:hypothetical protein
LLSHSDEQLEGGDNVSSYDPDALADGWERFDESSSEETNDWDDDSAVEQGNIQSGDEA